MEDESLKIGNERKRIESFDSLYTIVTGVDMVFANNASKAINKNLTARNWLIGYYIFNYEQNGRDRAKYGAKTLQRLAEKLNSRSLSYRNLKLYRQFFMEFSSLAQPIYDFVRHEAGLMDDLSKNLSIDENWAITDCLIQKSLSEVLNVGNDQIRQSVIAQTDEGIDIPSDVLFNRLSFTHLSLIMSKESPLARAFYEHEAIKGVWTVRELKRQIDTNYFERSGISSCPSKMSAYIQSNATQMTLAETVKSPYVYEFLGLKDVEIVEESHLEQALIDHLEEFMLELGSGFCFEDRQKRILVDDEYYYCDLVFYHRVLKCHVLIDLKASRLKYEDVAQMNLYLSYYKHNIMQPDDNPPVGILMCTQVGKELVQYATEGIDENLFVQKYRLNIPSESRLTEWLKDEIKKYEASRLRQYY